MKYGIFKARAVKDLVQFGETDNENAYPQLAVVMRMTAEGETQESTTFLIFSPDAAPYAFERLKSLGWSPKVENDISDLTGIDKNEVDVRCWLDDYKGKPQPKCEILSGGGRVKLARPVDPKTFAARVAAITGKPVAGSTSSKAPF
jgi:hypothetical protein